MYLPAPQMAENYPISTVSASDLLAPEMEYQQRRRNQGLVAFGIGGGVFLVIGLVIALIATKSKEPEKNKAVASSQTRSRIESQAETQNARPRSRARAGRSSPPTPSDSPLPSIPSRPHPADRPPRSQESVESPPVRTMPSRRQGEARPAIPLVTPGTRRSRTKRFRRKRGRIIKQYLDGLKNPKPSERAKAAGFLAELGSKAKSARRHRMHRDGRRSQRGSKDRRCGCPQENRRATA